MTTMASVTFLAQEILGTEDLPDYQAGSRTLSTETSIKRSPDRQPQRKGPNQEAGLRDFESPDLGATLMRIANRSRFLHLVAFAP
jgi:hypothetical protein